VTADGVDGVDITVPVYQFSETHYFSNAQVTGAYKGAIFSCTGKTNAGGFKGFAPGEVLFLGATGSKRGDGPDDDWEITFRFAPPASPNETGLSVGSTKAALILHAAADGGVLPMGSELETYGMAVPSSSTFKVALNDV
jgi:hypothetical protein